ncbi:MAG: hypothetical protein KC505_07825 [Myxococcales bacterium]|nr:hypothetical protein [Myxococcales bacterium]USN50653.1 MAG: hypothetical protein H6731_10385 [Myxococcales bacterium]
MKLALNGVFAAMTVALLGFLGGCGPQNLNDADYLAQMSEAGLDQNGVMSKNDESNSDESSSEAPMMADATPVVKLPPRYVHVPSIVERQPTVVTTSDEDREYVRDIYHNRTKHIMEPSRHIHTINKKLTNRHLYHTKVVHHPTNCNQVRYTGSVKNVQEMLPDTEVTTPVRNACPGVCPGRGFGYYPRFYGRFHRGLWLR